MKSFAWLRARPKALIAVHRVLVRVEIISRESILIVPLLLLISALLIALLIVVA